ncbi:conserved domain protein (plasmid) [Enterococcus mundtii QU 25]|uniref:AbiH family protein n=1 Tax=Enterococcus mundtii TaxID=53346 RepID=UPI0003C56144|nr:AbiH family protein [Enterococcus mundtii]BAO08731.1 conserved domain protein [Enterococcus mundtii QU 25]
MARKLIILGNGFDLACGLNSKYSDFFDDRFSCIEPNMSNVLKNAFKEFNYYFNRNNINGYNFTFDTILDIKERHRKNQKSSLFLSSPFFANAFSSQYEKVIKESNLTFWDIVLFYSQEFGEQELTNVKWQDVENRMLDFLVQEEINKPSLKKMLKAINKNENLDKINWFCLYLAKIIAPTDFVYCDIMDYLYRELCRFEKAFLSFLNKEVEKCEYYTGKATQLLIEIASVVEMKELLDQKILSFNYTNPLPRMYLDMTNVHGTLQSEKVIFGIDQEKINPSESVYRFTKTFRQMTETDISKRNKELILPAKDSISEIAFFGHSLSELDYSYFQTIFDFYSLYDSTVKLSFYYKVYKGTDSLTMELDLSNRISKMLRSYGPSIDNEKKANNLMHKLLLEKRLVIEEIT